MVNIRNDEIKLLKKMLDEYFNGIRNINNYFKYQDVICRLNAEMEIKKQKNKGQYDDRVFWKRYNEVIKNG